MSDIINEYFRRTPKWPREAIQCADGFSISVQAHRGAYSTPRESNYEGNYTHFECGFPSAPVPELSKWKDGDNDDRSTDTQSVYGYVPLLVVLNLLNNHGGAVSL